MTNAAATLYTFADTGGASSRPLWRDRNQFDMQVGAIVDPAKWEVVVADWPNAHMPWDGVGFEAFLPTYSILAGARQGAQAALDLISQRPGKFSFASNGLGSLVAWLAYVGLTESGSVYADRAVDFVGAVTFGSPVREEGHTIPGSVDHSGKGILGDEYRAVSTPSSWWDFANRIPLDPYTTNGDDPTSAVITTVADAVLINTNLTTLSNVIDVISQVLPDLDANTLSTAWNALTRMYFPFMSQHDTTGHNAYGNTYYGLAGNSLSAVQLAANYLNTLVPVTGTRPATSGPGISVSASPTSGRMTIGTKTSPLDAPSPYPFINPDHFYLDDDVLHPQPWMQHRQVATTQVEGVTGRYAVTSSETNIDFGAVLGDLFNTAVEGLGLSGLFSGVSSATPGSPAGANKNDLLQKIGPLSWTNDTPVNQWVYGLVTRGGSRVTLQARSRGYLVLLSSYQLGTSVGPISISSVMGCGMDLGLGGVLALGTAYGILEQRQNTVTFPVAPEKGGWFLLNPGQTITFYSELRFVSEFWESSQIDGGNLETESSYDTGDTRFDIFAIPVI